MITFSVANDDGREWIVRAIERGEHYGLDGVLVNDSEDPLVEFLDPSFPDSPAGFLVQRYRLSILWSAHGGGVAFSADDPD